MTGFQALSSDGAGRFHMRGPAPFILAARLCSYPTEVVRQDILALISKDIVNFSCAEFTEIELWEALHASIKNMVHSEKNCKEAASRYIDIFDRGTSENSLYETEYGLRRSQLKTGELADISGFYQAFGFRMVENNDSPEMPDHIAVECEFYALLLAKQAYLLDVGNNEGGEIVFDARKKFLRDHLGRFPSVIAERPGVRGDPFYSLVFKWCAELISDECDELDVGVVPVDYSYSGDREDNISCGGIENIVTRIGNRKMS